MWSIMITHSGPSIFSSSLVPDVLIKEWTYCNTELTLMYYQWKFSSCHLLVFTVTGCWVENMDVHTGRTLHECRLWYCLTWSGRWGLWRGLQDFLLPLRVSRVMQYCGQQSSSVFGERSRIFALPFGAFCCLHFVCVLLKQSLLTVMDLKEQSRAAPLAPTTHLHLLPTQWLLFRRHSSKETLKQRFNKRQLTL